jgi:hypothetical protein
MPVIWLRLVDRILKEDLFAVETVTLKAGGMP